MKRVNVTKEDLKREIKFNVGLPFSLSEKILNSLFEIIIEGLHEHGVVKISNFGKFKVLKKKQRIGRNPKTMEEFPINKRKVVTFYPALSIKRKINEEKEQSSI